MSWGELVFFLESCLLWVVAVHEVLFFVVALVVLVHHTVVILRSADWNIGVEAGGD